MDLTFIVDEIALKGSVSMGRCSQSTLYRWAQNINLKLKSGKYDWRVKANAKTWKIEKV